jgi:hypothetical protein
MVLIAHDAVKADFIGQGVLLVILVVEHVGFRRIKIGVGKTQTPRLVLSQIRVRDVAIGLLRKPIDFDLILRPCELLNHRVLLLEDTAGLLRLNVCSLDYG